MNNSIKAQAVNTYGAKENLKLSWTPNNIIPLVIEEDRRRLIPYIEDELKATEQLSKDAEAYAHELRHLLAMAKEDENV